MIELSRLTKVYGGSCALRGVSLQVPAGSVLSVLGHNGSGKTTVLRMVATLIRPTAGSGRVGGHDLVRDREEVRRLVGLVGHGTQLYEDLTPLENLAFAAALDDGPRDRHAAEASLARVGLEAHADVRVRELSTGMRRRVALARVMLRRPRVLLLDEPFSGLDQDGSKRLEEYLGEFRAEGGAALLVTHSLPRALTLGDAVAVLAGGRLAAHEPASVLTEERLRQLSLAAVEAEA